MTGKYGVALPYDTEALSSTSQPCVRWECTHSYTRRDLPTPASPTSATTWPCPALACSRACCMTTSSWSRPTKRVRPRARLCENPVFGARGLCKLLILLDHIFEKATF